MLACNLTHRVNRFVFARVIAHCLKEHDNAHKETEADEPSMDPAASEQEAMESGQQGAFAAVDGGKLEGAGYAAVASGGSRSNEVE